MIHTDEDDEFERIERENKIKGQPYHFEKREWVGLTDEEIGDEYVRFEVPKGGFNRFEYAVRAIENKLKERNT